MASVFRPFAVLALVIAVVGCVGSESTPATEEERLTESRGPPGNYDFSWKGAESTLAERTWDFGFEMDINCRFGGAPMLQRSEARINETDHLRVRVSVGNGDVATGLRIGYVVDGNGADYQTGQTKEITWLEPVAYGDREFEIPTAEETWEHRDNPERWDFYHMHNPADGSLCYTGAGAFTGQALSPTTVTIEAVKTS